MFTQALAKKFDGSQRRTYPGRPRIDVSVETLVIRMAEDNPGWGYDRIVGALSNIGHTISPQTVANVLKRHGIAPAPHRAKTMTWAQLVRQHKSLLVSTDFFSTEVWTHLGLVTFYVLFFIRLSTREVYVAGMTAHPTQEWMQQMARNITMSAVGFLRPGDCLLPDRDAKYCAAFRTTIGAGDVTPITLPPCSPNFNAYTERWVRSIKSECLDQLILFGENSLRRAVREYTNHYHQERNHQGIGNILIEPLSRKIGKTHEVHRRERLGGLLNYYHRDAA